MIYIGNIVNTHGIKGEVKILSDINNKELVFKKGNQVIVNNQTLTIKTYRIHKQFDMLTFEGIEDINLVLPYKGQKLTIEKSQLPEDILFDEDYIGLDVYSHRFLGKVTNIMKNSHQDILVIENDKKTHLIPNVPAFIEKVDLENHKIMIHEIEGLIDED